MGLSIPCQLAVIAGFLCRGTYCHAFNRCCRKAVSVGAARPGQRLTLLTGVERTTWGSYWRVSGSSPSSSPPPYADLDHLPSPDSWSESAT